MARAVIRRRRIIYVPVITEKQLRRIEKAAQAMSGLMDLAEELDAAFNVLKGETEPEGWKQVRVRKDRVRQKAKKAL